MKTLLSVFVVTMLSAGYASAHGLADRIDEVRSFPNQSVATATPEEQCEQASVAEQRPVVASTHALQDARTIAMAMNRHQDVRTDDMK